MAVVDLDGVSFGEHGVLIVHLGAVDRGGEAHAATLLGDAAVDCEQVARGGRRDAGVHEVAERAARGHALLLAVHGDVDVQRLSVREDAHGDEGCGERGDGAADDLVAFRGRFGAAHGGAGRPDTRGVFKGDGLRRRCARRGSRGGAAGIVAHGVSWLYGKRALRA